MLLLFYISFLLKINKGLLKIKSAQSNKFVHENNEFVSVIIPFRNESETIVENLRCLENQNIPIDKYEVIYIDDRSDDDSLQKLKSSISKNNISAYSVENIDHERAHKKRAIELGMEKAKGDIIILTDADCINESTWISSMVAEFSSNTGLTSASG